MDITLGERISTLRRQKELTQENLAKELNVSAQAVSKWENDQTCPDISLLPELARILGVTVDELLSGKTGRGEKSRRFDTVHNSRLSGRRQG